MNIILLAPPAAGKGTLSEMLEARLNLVHISSGDLLREKMNDGSSLGDHIRDDMQKGNLIADEIIFLLLKEYIVTKDLKNGFILDGLPRNRKQAEQIDQIFNELDQPISNVFLLNTDVEILKKRIFGRRNCPKCKASYNINNPDLKPKKDNICDKCGSELTTRSDDNLESFMNRLNIYEQETKPIINYYRDKEILSELDSSTCHEKTFEEAIKILKKEMHNDNY